MPGGHFIESGINCYRTGDLGMIDGDLLYCRGRKDRQIKWKGYRIELDEIEHALSAIVGVQDCAVDAATTESGVVRFIKAFVVLKPGTDLSTVRAALHQTLPDYMIPKRIKQLESLPVNEHGKLDRRRIHAL